VYDRPSLGHKGVIHSPWKDLTATITSAVAGGLDSDPGSIAGSLTVATTTGTFNGETVPCNEFAWTTTAATRDGYDEASYVFLGTTVSLLPSWTPTTVGFQFAADIVDTGTLNGTAPIIAVLDDADGAIGGGESLYGTGWLINSATSTGLIMRCSTTLAIVAATIDPTVITPTAIFRNFAMAPVANRNCIIHSVPNDTNATIATYFNTTRTVGQRNVLLLGQNTVVAAAASGIKIRFRCRTFDLQNIYLGDLDLGCAS